MEPQIITVLIILSITITLLILDIFRIDIIAILCMLSLGWTRILAPAEMLSGFSSNAVIAMISVMILGSGIAKTGIMNKVAKFIIKLAGKSRQKIIGLVSISVGIISAFMQNVGSAALFLPAVLNISKRERIPASELIMPLGFAAILGGTLTMIASGPLILLNDLLKNAKLEPYGLFGVTPAGIILLVVGIGFFFFFGKWFLPHSDSSDQKESEQKKLIDTWHLHYTINCYTIPENSQLVSKTPERTKIWEQYNINILAVSDEEDVTYAPWRYTRFKSGQRIAIMGKEKDMKKFATDFQLHFNRELNEFQELMEPTGAGFVEVIIPPRSSVIGSTIRQLSFRKNYSVEPLIFFSKGKKITGDFSDHKIKAGDTIIMYGVWENMLRLKESSDFVVITSIEEEEKRRGKGWIAISCFAAAIGLTISGFPISISLFSGAIAMVLTGVIRIDEIYNSVEWKVVFLIAGLIPLGLAMQKTGTAAFLAENVMSIVQGSHPIIILLSISTLATLFSLFMSNVASTVVLVPLVISIAQIGQLDPRPLVLLVGVCSANSLILPTHQVNAMLMTAGGYSNKDYFKAGGVMTIIFLITVTAVFYLFYI